MATQAQALDWITKQNGKWLDFDGFYGAQCVDLISYYCEYLGIPKKWGNARYWWEDKNYNGGGLLTRHSTPQPGDIAVFKPNAGNGYAGHISLVHSVGNGSFRSLDQNWVNANLTSGSKAAWVNHPHDSNVYGFLRPTFEGGVNVDRIKELEAMADFRQTLLNSIGEKFGIKAPVDGNSVPQIIANIATERQWLEDRTKQVGELEKLNKELQTKLETAQSVNGDAGKWKTLKSLIKELIS